MQNIRRMIAGAAAVCFLVVVLLSMTFVISHTHHDCTGEHCTICVCLDHARGLLKQLAAGRVSYALYLIGKPLPVLGTLLFGCLYLAVTPVALKIRMNR